MLYICCFTYIGEQFSDEFKRINPTAKVPAIQDNDFTLFER